MLAVLWRAGLAALRGAAKHLLPVCNLIKHWNRKPKRSKYGHSQASEQQAGVKPKPAQQPPPEMEVTARDLYPITAPPPHPHAPNSRHVLSHPWGRRRSRRAARRVACSAAAAEAVREMHFHVLLLFRPKARV